MTPRALALLLWLVLLAGCPATRSVPPAGVALDEPAAERLRAHVEHLASAIGPRHPQGEEEALEEAADYVAEAWRELGLTVGEQRYALESGVEVRNLVTEISGSDPSLPLVLVGAHYDTVFTGTPGADDNASGVAVLLELSRALADATPRRTVRLVAFTCEEPPYFQTADMGSLRYALALQAEGVEVAAMFALDCVGVFSDEPGSQRYLPGQPPGPSQGDFAALVGNAASRDLVERAAAAFAGASELGVEPQVLPDAVHEAGWSDHWSFWQTGVPALVVSDSGPFRNAHYHELSDTPETLDYARMAQLSDGLLAAVLAEANRE